MRECLTEIKFVENPGHIEKFWRENVESAPYFNPDVESLWVFLLNTRYKLIGFLQNSQGTTDTILIDPAVIFRAAVAKNAKAIVIAHNHPSGDPSPSDKDIKATRDLLCAGRLLKIELLDHVIIGDVKSEASYRSLREMGHFNDLSGERPKSEKPAEIEALKNAVFEFENVKMEAVSLFELLYTNLGWRQNCAGENCKSFLDGASLLVNAIQEKLEKSFNAIHSAAHAAFPPPSTT